MTANHPNTDLHFAYTSKASSPRGWGSSGSETLLVYAKTKCYLENEIKNRMGSFDVGVLPAREPPLPIPNREVQPRRPDDTFGLG